MVETRSGGIYEALLDSTGAAVQGDINRLDWAGHATRCLDRGYTQLFCHCKEEEPAGGDLFQEDLYTEED